MDSVVLEKSIGSPKNPSFVEGVDVDVKVEEPSSEKEDMLSTPKTYDLAFLALQWGVTCAYLY